MINNTRTVIWACFRMTEQEEIIRDKSRSLSVVESRISYLENENRHLQKRVDSLTSQKQTLDKLVKDFQQNRDLEVLLHRLNNSIIFSFL